MEQRLRDLLLDCQASFRRIQALLEWRNLETGESRPQAPRHMGQETTRRDLREEVMRFEDLTRRAHGQSDSLPAYRKRVVRQWLARLREAVGRQLQPKGI